LVTRISLNLGTDFIYGATLAAAFRQLVTCPCQSCKKDVKDRWTGRNHGISAIGREAVADPTVRVDQALTR
jgi:hypothetical protein